MPRTLHSASFFEVAKPLVTVFTFRTRGIANPDISISTHERSDGCASHAVRDRVDIATIIINRIIVGPPRRRGVGGRGGGGVVFHFAHNSSSSSSTVCVHLVHARTALDEGNQLGAHNKSELNVRLPESRRRRCMLFSTSRDGSSTTRSVYIITFGIRTAKSNEPTRKLPFLLCV